jgi:hypothetical protein
MLHTGMRGSALFPLAALFGVLNPFADQRAILRSAVFNPEADRVSVTRLRPVGETVRVY